LSLWLALDSVCDFSFLQLTEYGNLFCRLVRVRFGEMINQHECLVFSWPFQVHSSIQCIDYAIFESDFWDALEAVKNFLQMFEAIVSPNFSVM
jgi:hypothetical protein